jgi:hypothetical protein
VEHAVEPTTPGPAGHRRALVFGSRTVLIMLLVAAVALLGLGVATLVLGDPPEAGGWLRSVFGTVFGAMAVLMAVVLGVPAAVGVWAMAGATAGDAVPAMSRSVRRIMVAIALVALALVVVVVIALGDRLTILDLALMALAALPTLGLAGAVAFSPRRGRAILSALALVAVAAGVAWIALQAYATLNRLG